MDDGVIYTVGLPGIKIIIIFNFFQNYRNADVTFYCSWKLKYGPVSIDEYWADMRKRREEKTIFKKFGWTIWVPGRPFVFSKLSVKNLQLETLIMINHVNLFCFKEAVFHINEVFPLRNPINRIQFLVFLLYNLRV